MLYPPLMIPYWPQPVLEIAGLRFYSFGALVEVALAVGYLQFLRRAHRQGLNETYARQFILSVAAAGFLGSHVLGLLVFAPNEVLKHPLEALNFSGGIYSFAGLAAGVITAWWLFRRYRLPVVERWRYLDNLTYAFTFGWIFGRAGCALAHDHIGIASDSWFAVRFPDGPRLDLGLLEFILTCALAAAFAWLDRRPRRPGFFLGWFLFTYGAFRIWRGALEVNHQRFAGLSMDQVFALAAVCAGVWIIIRLKRLI